MFPTFKKWFVPSTENGHTPYFFRAVPVAFLVLTIGVLFVASGALKELLTDEQSFLAAVVASVLVDLTNSDRAVEGLHGLSVNAVLVEAAQAKADDMAAKSYFAHNSPDGKTPWYWFGEAGYNFAYAGENLAVFFGDSEDVERAWMNSPGHRANILNSNFSEIGIATAEGVYQGQQTVFVVQMFGTPRVAKPLATLSSETILEEVPTEAEGEVGGETAVVISESDQPEAQELTVIHQDELFVAVKDENAVVAPSTESVAPQANWFEHLLASPETLLSYTYGVLAAIVGLALVLLVFLEVGVQKPLSIFLGIVLLGLIGALFFAAQDNVVLAQVSAIIETVSG